MDLNVKDSKLNLLDTWANRYLSKAREASLVISSLCVDNSINVTVKEKETTVEGVHLWYNGELSSTPQEDGTIKIMCTNDVCAYVPKESEAYGKTILFECSRYQCKTEA